MAYILGNDMIWLGAGVDQLAAAWARGQRNIHQGGVL